MRRISLLGSTGSIGRQSLDVISACGMTVAALTANRDAERMEEQARRFKPELAVMMDPAAAADLRVRLADTGIRVASGPEGLQEAAALPSADTVITAVVGMVGLKPTLAAIRPGQAHRPGQQGDPGVRRGAGDGGGGALRRGDRARGLGALRHVPVPPGLPGQGRGPQRLILTASGGPFFGYTGSSWTHVTLDQALKHPNWSMGAKITVDSATLMNKGLEFIEAMRLYHMPPEKISMVVHRESIVHSLVEYCDNAMIAQLGSADMRLPIQYALTWPARTQAVAKPLDLLTCPPLHLRAAGHGGLPLPGSGHRTRPGRAAPPRRCSTAPTRRRWGCSWRGRSPSWTFPGGWSGPSARWPRCTAAAWRRFWPPTGPPGTRCCPPREPNARRSIL